MNRVPEPELMNNTEQARAYAETDFSEAHDAFVAHFRSRFPEFSEGKVIDLGCGAADVVIRYARALPKIFITGIDGAQAMLDIGLKDVEQNGFHDRIKLYKCLLPHDVLSLGKYDAVISNSLLHHLNDPMILWDIIITCSRQGSPVFIMDLMRPDSPDKAHELVHMHAGDASPLLQKDFYNSLLAAYREDEIKKQLKEAHLDYFSVEVISDRHVIVWGTVR